MKEKFSRWMQGRYGVDDYDQFLGIIALILAVVNIFTKKTWLNFLVLAMLIYLTFRMLSRNISQRQAENQKYLRTTQSIRNGFRDLKRLTFGEKGYKYFKCENCQTMLRVPKGKGKVKITCPHCGHKMIKRS